MSKIKASVAIALLALVPTFAAANEGAPPPLPGRPVHEGPTVRVKFRQTTVQTASSRWTDMTVNMGDEAGAASLWGGGYDQSVPAVKNEVWAPKKFHLETEKVNTGQRIHARPFAILKDGVLVRWVIQVDEINETLDLSKDLGSEGPWPVRTRRSRMLEGIARVHATGVSEVKTPEGVLSFEMVK